MQSRCKPSLAGFALPELILALSVLILAGVLVMPATYEDRRSDNERMAQDVLRMIGSAQHSWRQATGDWAELYELQYTPGGGPSDLEPFLPWLPVSADAANYGGYRFTEVRDEAGRIIGCRADPITPPFSGRETFGVTYASLKLETGPLEWR